MNLIGQRFGSFQLLREVGRGALARVFLASDGQRLVAVKLFRPEHRARAERELRHGRGLDHPNLNPIEGAIELRGFPGLVMPFVSGERLDSWRAAHREPKEFVGAVSGVLRGLAHLHEQGTIHRDVKPENILVERRGRPVLLDYDLAAVSGDPQGEPEVVGTVAFLSPEQAQGGSATAASDLYSAGIILYWGLTGQVPFSGAVSEVLHAHAACTPPAVSSFDPELARFEPLLAALLEKRPERRPASGAEVADELESLLSQG